jgi:hypothetical protein
MTTYGQATGLALYGFLTQENATGRSSCTMDSSGQWQLYFAADAAGLQMMPIPSGESGMRVPLDEFVDEYWPGMEIFFTPTVPLDYPTLERATAYDYDDAYVPVDWRTFGAMLIVLPVVGVWAVARLVRLVALGLREGLSWIGKTTLLWTVVLIVISVTVLGTVGCGPEKIKQPTLPQVTRHQHRGFVSIQACINSSKSEFSTALVHQALNLIGSSVLSVPQDDFAGASIYVTFTADPTNPTNTLALSIPSIAAYPAVPQLVPTPTTDPNNPYASAGPQATATTSNQGKIDTYTAQVTAVQQKIAAVQAQVQAWVQHIKVPTDTGTGASALGQCVGLGSVRFNNQPPGEHFLVIASNVDWPGDVSIAYPLTGTKVDWIDATCQPVSFCQQTEGAWAGVFDAAGVNEHDHLWFDSGESATLSNIFAR